MRTFNVALLSGVLTVSTAVFAGTSVNQESSQTVSTSLQDLEQQQMTKNAQQWGLSTEEWQRYEQLKQGRRGVLSPGLDPLTMLGIEARNDEERRHFAELTVKQEFQRVEAELAFQREVNSAWARVFPGVLPVRDVAAKQVNGRQALFVKDNCPACDHKLAQLIKANHALDIYLVDSAGKDDAVRNWAKKHNIPAGKVRSRQITLNHDSGMWLKYGNGQMPVVMEQGAQGWQRVN